jgi:hypothetical protein
MRILLLIILCSVSCIAFALDKDIASTSSRKEPKTDTVPGSYFNECMLSMNYNDIASYVGADNKWGYGIGVYHHSNIRNGFSTRWGMEYNVNRYYGPLAADHHHGMYWYSDMDATVSFLSLPLTFSYHFGERYRIAPEIGVHADINLNAAGKGTYSSVQLNSGGFPPATFHKKEVHLDDVSIRRLNAGPHAGLSVYIPLGKNNLLLRGEYRFGLLDISDSYNTNSIYNRYFRFSAGYGFGMKQLKSSTKRHLFFNEFRVSTNHDFNKFNYSNSYSSTPEVKPLPGFGVGVYHLSTSLKGFQYQVGLDFNRINLITKYHHYRVSLSNAVRYSFTNGKARPFLQLGVAPEVNFLRIKKIESEQRNNIDGRLANRYNSTNTSSEINSIIIEFSAGVGCSIAGDKRDYIMLAEYFLNNWDFYPIDGKSYHSNYLKLSLGMSLGARK